MKISEKAVSFRNAWGEKLVGTLFTPQKPNGRAVVFLHGFGGRHSTANKLAWARAVARLGFIALGFDFSGCGGSGGDFALTSYSRQVGEVKSAMGFLSHRFGVREFGLVGHSMGGVDALIAAGLSPKAVFAVAAIAAPYRIHDFPEDMAWMISKEQAREWPKRGYLEFDDDGVRRRLNYSFKTDQRTFGMAKVVSKVIAPVLIVHGTKDSVVPVAQARTFAQKLDGNELALINGGDHRLRKHTAQVQAALRRFFRQFAD